MGIMLSKRRAGRLYVTQAAAARRMEVTQPRLNDLLRGRFSLDALTVLAARAGLRVRMRIEREPARTNSRVIQALVPKRPDTSAGT